MRCEDRLGKRDREVHVKRSKLRYLFMLACAAVMLLVMSQVSFADDWNVESITFTPASDTVRMSDIMRADNDGPLKLDLAYRNDGLFNNCFFTGGDRCIVTYNDGSTKEFRFRKIENPLFAVFRATDGSGDEIELEALSTEISREIRNSVEGSADELAAIIGSNKLQIEYGVYDPDTGLGQRVLCDCTITVIEDTAHDCTKALRERNQNDPTCEASGFSQLCWFCQICGKYYLDDEASREIAKKDVFLPALGHDWNYKVDKPATCTADGSRSIHCSRCDAVKDGTEEVIPATGHSYSPWKTVKKASETAAGQKMRSCSNGCGSVEKAAIKQLAPTLPAVVIRAPKAAKRSATVRWKKVSAKTHYLMPLKIL